MEITNTDERAEQMEQLTPAENNQTEAPVVRRPRLTPEQRKQREAARKRKQILNYVFLGLFAAMFLVEIFAFVAVVRLKMLPGLLVALMALVFWHTMCWLPTSCSCGVGKCRKRRPK